MAYLSNRFDVTYLTIALSLYRANTKYYINEQKDLFHISVTGLSFTDDNPLKFSQFGIDSVISIVDDILPEKIRKIYCDKFKIPYNEISDKIEDLRAERVTSYLN